MYRDKPLPQEDYKSQLKKLFRDRFEYNRELPSKRFIPPLNMSCILHSDIQVPIGNDTPFRKA
jgi:hypothetical protein